METKITTEQEALDYLMRMCHSDIHWRLDTEDDGQLVLSLIDRQIYPRVFHDMGLEGEINIIAESEEHLIERLMPVLQKDWKWRQRETSLVNLVENLRQWYSEML